MHSIRYYGPALVLMLTLIATMLLGPDLMRQMAFADETGRIEANETRLNEADTSGMLGTLVTQFRSVAASVRPSVVHITVKKKFSNEIDPDERRMLEEFHERFGMPLPPQLDPEGPGEFENEVPQPYGNGSGWVYDDAGHIITNYHVVRDADVIEVSMHDKSVLRASLVGADPNTDIAVIKLDRPRRVHPAALSEEPAQQGDIVFAFGSPFGETFSFSMSQGIVSGKGRVLGILDERDRFGRRTRSGYENFIQTDAAINPGNSGGPLVDVRGRVIGMNTAIASRNGRYQGLGFAIPAEMIRRYVPQLINDGKVRRGYLGIAISDDPKLLKSFGQDRGVLVDNLLPDGPAGEAGLQIGDVIVEIDGKKIFDAEQLRNVIADLGPNVDTQVTVVRRGERQTHTVTLAELPSSSAVAIDLPGSEDEAEDAMPDEVSEKLKPLQRLGLTKLDSMTDEKAQRYRLEQRDGVIIESVRPGSAAESVDLRTGMVITEVQGQKVATLEELTEAIEEVDPYQGVRLRVAVPTRGGWQDSFVFLNLPE